jgi:hypothetical protein
MTKRLVLGGTDFGPWQFKWMDMSLPPFFDGSIGHDFFATHVVCIDFPEKRIVIPRSTAFPCELTRCFSEFRTLPSDCFRVNREL